MSEGRKERGMREGKQVGHGGMTGMELGRGQR